LKVLADALRKMWPLTIYVLEEARHRELIDDILAAGAALLYPPAMSRALCSPPFRAQDRR
jgi:fructose-1,6-bisphosphatase/sedoheptulose 1,7-bisphosphatase-like protein